MRRAIENVILDGVDGTASNLGDIVVTDAVAGQILVYASGPVSYTHLRAHET